MEKVNLLGVNGKQGSGKDTVGKIIQYLIAEKKGGDIPSFTIQEFLEDKDVYYQNYKYGEINEESISNDSGWKIVKFADNLKDIVCILTGCTREQLESQEFKNSSLPDEWKIDKDSSGAITYRTLLQKLGTDLLRNQLHSEVWVNALFSKYRDNVDFNKNLPPNKNWIISDVRFPNEAKAVKNKGGIIIRINRDLVIGGDDYGFTKVSVNQAEKDGIIKPQHISETALDNYDFDWIIDNNGSIEDLIVKTKEMLIHYGVI